LLLVRRGALAPYMKASMTNDIAAICTGFLVLGFLSWTLMMTPKHSPASETHVVRALADDPDLKLISEQSPFMRSER
jgi:hypothetical protein